MGGNNPDGRNGQDWGRSHVMKQLNASPEAANEMAALTRLVAIAKSDTGQSRKVADFLLAWWNADTCGGFDLFHLCNVDKAIADDMLAVCRIIQRTHAYPDSFGFKADFEKMVADWRPRIALEESHQ